jgi:hypothetical protein
MLTVSQGRLVAMSTPKGQRGWFFDAWHDPSAPWRRIKVTAYDVPRIDRAFLEEQRKVLGPRWFEQDFLCVFHDASDQVFPTEAVLAAFDSHEEPLFAST